MVGCRGCRNGSVCDYHEAFNDGVEAILPREVMTAEEFLASLEESES
jgi:hypothetical protein